MVKTLIRALRLPFITASVLPFIFGSLTVRDHFFLPGFILGVTAVAFAHLSANLINDYADSKSGADWQDRRFFGFFGGSKLIQEGVLSEKFYFKLAAAFAFVSLGCIIILSRMLKSVLPLEVFFIAIFLAWAYTCKPFAFSYRGLGEPLVFLLYGPVPVMAGYYIQTGIFPDARSLIMSLPFGFLTTNILFANEVPDYGADKKAGKRTWVELTGPKNAFVIYYLITFLFFASVALGVYLGYLKWPAVLAFILSFPAVKAAGILREYSADKEKLVASSMLTVNIQLAAGIILILAVLL